MTLPPSLDRRFEAVVMLGASADSMARARASVEALARAGASVAFVAPPADGRPEGGPRRTAVSGADEAVVDTVSMLEELWLRGVDATDVAFLIDGLPDVAAAFTGTVPELSGLVAVLVNARVARHCRTACSRCRGARRACARF